MLRHSRYVQASATRSCRIALRRTALPWSITPYKMQQVPLSLIRIALLTAQVCVKSTQVPWLLHRARWKRCWTERPGADSHPTCRAHSYFRGNQWSGTYGPPRHQMCSHTCSGRSSRRPSSVQVQRMEQELGGRVRAIADSHSRAERPSRPGVKAPRLVLSKLALVAAHQF